MSDGEHSGAGRLLAGRYRLVSVVGRGGMGTVWRARDETLHRDVAVKEVALHHSLTAEERADRHRRTLREARASARLNHPGVVTVHDVVDEDDRPWIVMELVDARSLQDVVDTGGPLPPERAAAIGRQVVAALRAAHAIGILHRDVKPANVLVTDDDRAVLTDFGIAQMAGDATLTRTGLIMGSPAYMAPERLRGERAIPASDLWALGATLYTACEGRSPHHRSDAMAVIAAVMTLDAPPPRSAGPLTPVLRGLLERDPVRRMGADEADRALAAVAAGEAAPPVEDRTSPVPAPAPVPEPVAAPVPVPVPDETAPVPGTAAREWAPQEPARERRRALPFIAAGAAAAVIAVPAAVFVLMDEDEAKPSEPPALVQATGASPAPGDTPPATGTSPATGASWPDGLVRETGTGYSIGVPRGWRRTERGASTLWIDPVTGGYVQVDRTPWTGDPYEHWRIWQREAMADGKLPGLRVLRITRTRVGSVPAADIEFTWNRAGGTRARDRGVIAGGRSYAVVVALPMSGWSGNAALVKNVLDTFRPQGVG
ncbi:serine/threonine-protein kinase [Spirillospora albida]|uniref:serine/threonine-protein kinase n=1 Tax=Spirillospora albida TaxID=58123 RepID=UPI00068C6667|nr:serine/threonine-protein kinase [Spirillospora albida]